MLDKSIPYKSLCMLRPAELPVPPVPARTDGFTVKLFAPGDEIHWARIEKSVGEFSAESDALAYFQKEFAPQPELLRQRMCFLCTPEGLPVATATAWEKQGVHLLHWVACVPAFQRRGLGRAAVLSALHRFPDAAPVLLHTQTWSHDAILLYRSLGFFLSYTDRDADAFAEAMRVLKAVYPEKTWQQLMQSSRKSC